MPTKAAIESHSFQVRGIKVEVIRKDIKNLHLGVYPPLGRVRVAVRVTGERASFVIDANGVIAWSELSPVGINPGAIPRPEAIDEIAQRFGNQVLVLSLDARREAGHPSGFGVTTHGGRTSAGLDAIEWVREATERGAGEVLLNSMDADGTTTGFDVEMIAAVKSVVDVPVIASGGAGSVADFVAAARAGADAVLAASVFHYGTLTIAQVKAGLAEAGFAVR